MWTVLSAPGSATFSSGSVGDVGNLTCSLAEAVVVSLPPWGQEGYTSHQQRVPADSSQGLSPAPCLSTARKDQSQLFPTHCSGVSQQWRSELLLGFCRWQENSAAGAQDSRVLKYSSGETPTGDLAATFLTTVPTMQLVSFSGQRGVPLPVQRQ